MRVWTDPKFDFVSNRNVYYDLGFKFLILIDRIRSKGYDFKMSWASRESIRLLFICNGEDVTDEINKKLDQAKGYDEATIERRRKFQENQIQKAQKEWDEGSSPERKRWNKENGKYANLYRFRRA